MRLITSANDSYKWQILSEREYLFRKQLNKHFIETYRELCREVDVSFKTMLTLKSKIAAESKSFERITICLSLAAHAQLTE